MLFSNIALDVAASAWFYARVARFLSGKLASFCGCDRIARFFGAGSCGATKRTEMATLAQHRGLVQIRIKIALAKIIFSYRKNEMNAQEVIEFDNLRQKSTMLGEKEYSQILKAKAAPFVSENAHGVIRKVGGYQEVADIASACGGDTLSLLRSKDE